MFWSDSRQTSYGKIVFFLGSNFPRHTEGLSRSEFSRSALSRHHVRNAFGRGRRRIKNSASYAGAAKKRLCAAVMIVVVRIVSSVLHKSFSWNYRVRVSFRKVQISIWQSTDFHLAKYRFSFGKYRFPFGKVQIVRSGIQRWLATPKVFYSMCLVTWHTLTD